MARYSIGQNHVSLYLISVHLICRAEHNPGNLCIVSDDTDYIYNFISSCENLVIGFSYIKRQYIIVQPFLDSKQVSIQLITHFFDIVSCYVHVGVTCEKNDPLLTSRHSIGHALCLGHR